MLDAFEILTTSGIVLWRKQYTRISSSVVNSLINDVFIEERGGAQKGGTQDGRSNPAYRKDKYTLRWTGAKDVGLIFVAVYQSLLHLSWVDNLLTAVRALFIKQYAAELKDSRLTQLDCSAFDQTFDALVRRLDTGSTRRQSEPDSDAGPAQLTPPSSTVSAGEEALEDDEPPPPPPSAGAGLFKRSVLPQRGRSELADVDDTTSADATPVPTPDTSRPSTPLQQPQHSQLLTAKPGGPGKASRRARKANAAALTTSAPASSGDESPARKPKGGKNSVKQKRRWDTDGGLLAGAEGDDTLLDYSAPAAAPTSVPDGGDERDLDIDDVKPEEMGNRTRKGEFVLKDLDDEIDAILASTNNQTSSTSSSTTTEPSSGGGLLNSTTTRISSLFRNVVGGQTLTKASLAQPLQQMQTHLLAKNVAREAAERLCTAVETDLLNQKTATFTSIDTTIRASMSQALTRILTPTSSLDLLRAITDTISPTSSSASAAASGGGGRRPYVISIVGVNGVGKSTNLSKIAYFLLQNRLRVLVVAADTFRSGAVEQLRVHVRNLSELSAREGVGEIELFEKGYGKDAAAVARDAVTYAAAPAASGPAGRMRFDVVLIDTAGRRHNDARLMSSLTKFALLAKPDKVFMVGEALVGTDSVAQARNFAKEFVDETGQLRNNGVGMDGFIISKCDTVGDMVGTLVSMVHATGIPVVFLGVGQHYGDLRGLNVGWAVDKLMR